jgi:crotonobetainyl-CoA:carnitine CoA-transferase CaiB-like acyl-CoA transferase
MAVAPILTVEEAAASPQSRMNGYVVPFTHPNLGDVFMGGFPVQLSETPAEVRRSAPELGQHTEEVLIDMLGMSWEDIAELQDTEVI